MNRALYQTGMQRPIPSSPTDDGGQSTVEGGGGQSTLEGGGGASTVAAGGGGDELPWYSGLPDDLKGQPGVTRHASLTDAIQAGIAAEKRLGVPADQLVRLPTKPEDKEAIATIMKALGAPEAVDGYQINLRDGAGDDEKATLAGFVKHMHETVGPVPPQILQAATTWWEGQVAAAEEAENAAIAKFAGEAEATLKTEWGAAYDTTKLEIGKLISELGGQALVDELNLDAKLGSHPDLARFLKKVVDLRVEGVDKGDGQRGDVGTGKMTPSEAYAARAALEGDDAKRKALFDKSHPQHAAVVAERQRYLQAENPQAFAASQAAR